MPAAPDLFTADFGTHPYWWEAAAPSSDFPPGLPDEADVAVVGSGYSGLSAALELGRAGRSVSVLDAGPVGFGASTRNGGMLSKAPKFGSRDALTRRFGAALAGRIVEDGHAMFDSLEEVIRREGIECHLEQNGRFVGAHCRAAFRALEARVREYERDGIEGFEMITRERQHAIVGDSDYYHGGLLEPDGGSLHPALYHRGLVDACRRHAVRFHPETPVTAIAGEPGAFRLSTPSGELRAGEVVIGTNGYTGALTPWHRRRLVPVGSYIIATEELGEERVESMFRGFCTMSNTQRVLFYYRPSPDHRRILFGGRASFRATDPRSSAPTLFRYLCRVYPQLRGTRITRSWTGNVAFSFDWLPHMGVHRGMHYCMGCNGSGVAAMSYLGRQIGAKILGRRNRACAFAQIEFPARPLYTGTPWFLPLVGTWYRLRDHLDRVL